MTIEALAASPAFFISYAVSWLFLLICGLGIYGFYPPRFSERSRDASSAWWLILAIWIGFVGNGLNVLYWRVVGDPLVFYGVITLEELRYFGNGWGDILWKGAAALSVYLHFYARWVALPDRDKERWHPLTMAFHPEYPRWLLWFINFVLSRHHRQ